jgi:hypothetical protein
VACGGERGERSFGAASSAHCRRYL